MKYNITVHTLLLIAFLASASRSFAQKTFVDGGLRYSVSSEAPGEVSIIGVDSTATKSECISNDTLHVPSVVKKGKNKYQVAVIRQNAFSGHHGFSVVILDDGIRLVEYKAFAACPRLRSVFIPKSVEYISHDAFSDNLLLEEIIIDQDNPIYDSRGWCNAVVATDDDEIVLGCMGSTIPEGIKKIGDHAFDGVLTLQAINLPESLESIGREAFRNCTSLRSIKIPHGVTSIGAQVFEGCASLMHISVDDRNTTYDSRNGCNAVIETETATIIAGSGGMIIPDGVRRIAYGACHGIDLLTSIHIPGSVVQIESGAFGSLKSLATITVAPTNEVYYAPDGCNAIVERSTACLVTGCRQTVMTEDADIKSIGDMAFWGMSPTVLSFPQSLRCIGTAAFACSDELKAVYIPDNITEIGARAFMACPNLRVVHIGTGVETLPQGLFSWSGRLEVVCISHDMKEIGPHCFLGCHNLNLVNRSTRGEP